MRRCEIPLYLFAILTLAWWTFSGDDVDVHTPRQGPPLMDQGRETPLPGPSMRDPAVTIDSSGPVRNSTGTAFAIDEDGYWITARHVVDGCKTVRFHQPWRFKKPPAVKVWLHPNSDMALLEGPATGSAFSLADNPAGAGADAFHIGYPQGRPGDVWSQVIGRARMITRGRYRIDEPIIAYAEKQRFPNFSGSLGGISGGPIFNKRGKIIGVTVAESARRGRVMGTAPRSFKRLFNRAGITPSPTTLESPILSPAGLKVTGDDMRQRVVVAKVLCYAS